MSKKASLSTRQLAETAIQSIGLGYDLADDLRLKYCKQSKRRLVIIPDEDKLRDISIPGVGPIRDVPKPINCGKGERVRFSSDVLSFQQMSEQFNQELSLIGKIPTGHFNAAFEFREGWQRDAANTKTLAFDGVFITLYSIALEKSQLVLADHVKQAVPSTWEPEALAQFIAKYGTHIIVGVKMGGRDVIYAKQQHSSPLQPVDVQKKLKEIADRIFIDGAGNYGSNNGKSTYSEQGIGMNLMGAHPSTTYDRVEVQDIIFECKRKGGDMKNNLSHNEWSRTVQSEPEAISMTLIPMASLLSGIDGSGFLSHAINLYLRYKPPITELHQFLEFQLPRQWAPVFGEIPLGPNKRPQGNASLQLSFMGPKLYVNTIPVDVGKHPVTGLRLYLEGKRSNCLAIHLQHLSSQPKTFQLTHQTDSITTHTHDERRYYEKLKSFSHICTAPVESDGELSIITGAHFEVGDSGMKKVLFLRLHFSKVVGAVRVRQPVWDGSPVSSSQKSGIISTLMSTRFSSTTQNKPPPRHEDVNVNSAVYPGGPPVPAQTSKLLRFVDTTEMTRGPQDSPGYWVASGARLMADKGKISLQVKYSLLTIVLPDEESSSEF